MSLLKSFASWIAFLIVTGFTDWRLGLTAGLVVQVGIILSSRPVRIDILNGAMLTFFVVALGFAVASPNSGHRGVHHDDLDALARPGLVGLLAGRPAVHALDRPRRGLARDREDDDVLQDQPDHHLGVDGLLRNHIRDRCSRRHQQRSG